MTSVTQIHPESSSVQWIEEVEPWSAAVSSSVHHSRLWIELVQTSIACSYSSYSLCFEWKMTGRLVLDSSWLLLGCCGVVGISGGKMSCVGRCEVALWTTEICYGVGVLASSLVFVLQSVWLVHLPKQRLHIVRCPTYSRIIPMELSNLTLSSIISVWAVACFYEWHLSGIL